MGEMGRGQEPRIRTGISLPGHFDKQPLKAREEITSNPVLEEDGPISITEKKQALITDQEATEIRKKLADKGVAELTKDERGTLREYDSMRQPAYPADKLIAALRKNPHIRARGESFAEDLNPLGKAAITLDEIPRLEIDLVIWKEKSSELRRQAARDQVSYYDLVAEFMKNEYGILPASDQGEIKEKKKPKKIHKVSNTERPARGGGIAI
ncbi:hypothetical protein KKC88_00010 [Patescibacteria group bacterium]|nr:hypothetical protein [Patescibacteria group bacterium]MBU1963288.1 hypothetical protein [Patescibacteria group bacterium]